MSPEFKYTMNSETSTCCYGGRAVEIAVIKANERNKIKITEVEGKDLAIQNIKEQPFYK